MDRIKDLTNQLIEEGVFSIKKLQERYQGKKDDSVTIYSIWDEYIQEKNDAGKAGTARIGRDIQSRFIKDNGEEVQFADVGHTFIQK